METSDAFETENDSTTQYETLDIFIFQKFFDNLSQNFIPPLLGNLTYFTIPGPNAVKEKIIGDIKLFDEDLVFDYELWNLKVVSASLDPEPSIVQINYGDVTLGGNNLSINLTADYSYISDPPIFADMGSAFIFLPNATFNTTISSYRAVLPSDKGGHEFTLDFKDTYLDYPNEPFTKFDGISDFSEVLSNTVNTGAAVVKNRLKSMINGGDQYPIDAKVEEVINKVLSWIPAEIDLGNDLYIDGLLYSNIVTNQDELIIPLRTMLRSDDFPAYGSTHQCFSSMYSKVTNLMFDAQIAINDCSVNELLYSLYGADLLHLKIENPKVTTTLLRALLGKDIITVFGAEQPCQLTASP